MEYEAPKATAKTKASDKNSQQQTPEQQAPLTSQRSDQLTQAKFQQAANAFRSVDKPIQHKANTTGLPDSLKSGVEQLSGQSLDDVQVHYNSDKPAQLNALAYTQGTEIHVASGQEQHLPHETWHVVQQQQGRVEPTTEVNGASINDDTGLEKEADVMGAKASQLKSADKTVQTVTEDEELSSAKKS